MSDTTETTDAGPALTAEETKYFETGGESEIVESGADTSANTETTSPAGDKPAAETKPANEHVPLATFLSEKQARKELEKKTREFENQLAEMKGKFSILDRLKQGGEAEGDKPGGPIDPEADIFGAVRQVGETLAQMQKRQTDEAAAKQASDREATERQSFVNSYRADADKFKATAPDYMEAYNHLLQSRAQELLSIGYDDPADPLLTPDEKQAAAKALHEALTQDEMGIAQLAFSKNKSPAQIIYDLAQKRGYTKKGAAPAPAEDRLATIERGQAASKTLSSAGGPGGEQEMTGEQLAAMSLEEFDAWATKNPAKARRIMGG